MNQPMDLFKHWKRRQSPRDGQTFAPQTVQGFTLLEVLVVVFIIGILAALAGPSWLTMINITRVKKAQDAIALAINDAQRQARQNKSSRQVTIEQVMFLDSPSPTVRWAVHTGENEPNSWQNIEQEGLIIYPSSWTITFDDKGNTEDTGRMLITLYDKNRIDDDTGTIQISLKDRTVRCVIVKTLLGTVRQAEGADCNQP